MSEERIEEMQRLLEKLDLDGWLLFDFRRSNAIACQIAQLPEEQFLSRRWLYWVPRRGNAQRIVHKVEEGVLDHLPGDKRAYGSWRELHQHIADCLKDCRTVAMEVSPMGAIPYLSLVDAGTVEMVRTVGGVEVVSSAPLHQWLCTRLSSEQMASHFRAADVVDRAVQEAWDGIARALATGEVITEYQVQQGILERFEQSGCVTEVPPICAVNAHAADPHYMPQSSGSQTIRKGDFVLIDLWCKEKGRQGIYADITRVGVADTQPSERHNEIFSIVKGARDAAIELVRERYGKGTPVYGWEVDDACRRVIEEAGYGQYFVHRTGHNIGTSDHGDGAHIDNFETHDERELIPDTCFSIEPGIYLPGAFGVRSEVNVCLLQDRQVRVTGGVQDQITCLA